MTGVWCMQGGVYYAVPSPLPGLQHIVYSLPVDSAAELLHGISDQPSTIVQVCYTHSHGSTLCLATGELIYLPILQPFFSHLDCSVPLGFCPVWARGNPAPSLFTSPPSTLSFSIFYFSLFPFLLAYLFSCFSIPSYFTSIVPLLFQTRCHKRRLNLTLVFFDFV